MKENATVWTGKVYSPNYGDGASEKRSADGIFKTMDGTPSGTEIFWVL